MARFRCDENISAPQVSRKYEQDSLDWEIEVYMIFAGNELRHRR